MAVPKRKITDVEEGENNPIDMVDLEEYLQRGAQEASKSGILPKKIGVSFENLTVSGTGSGRAYITTFPEELAFMFGKGLLDLVRDVLGKKPEVKHIIQGFSGVVKPGEMLLVLGRPGSGTSTFLRALTNQQREFTSITGNINYSGIPFEEAKGRYRGEIMFNGEGMNSFIKLEKRYDLTRIYRGYPSSNFDSTTDSAIRNANKDPLQANPRSLSKCIRRANARSFRQDVRNVSCAQHYGRKSIHSWRQWRRTKTRIDH